MPLRRNSSAYTTGLDEALASEEICLKFPPKVISPGLVTLLVEEAKFGKLMDYAGPRLQFQLVVIFVLTQVIHSLIKQLGLPLFISQILAGMMLSPIVFSDQYSLVNVSQDSVAVIGTMGALGFVFFLFLTGVKMDISLVYKSGTKAVCLGLISVVVPLICCLVTVEVLHPGEGSAFTNKTLFLGVIYAGTSFPVIHCLLSELKILNSELGRLGLSAALVGDMLTISLTMIGTWAITGVERGRKEVMMDVGMGILYILIVMLAIRPALKWMVKRTPEAGQIKDICFYIVILLFLMTPKLTRLFRLHLLYGPFILGLAVPDGPPLGSALVEKLDPLISGLFLPVFATTCGMRLDSSYFKDYNLYASHQVIAAFVTLVSKFGVSLLLPILCKMPVRDSFALAFIMISKGIVEAGYFSIMSDARGISEDLFALMMMKIILVAGIVPLVVKRLYDPSRRYLCFQKRSIMHSKVHDLHILCCIHVPSNVNSIINLLNVSSPTKETSIVLDVLHLIKLQGAATPLFISHQQQKESLSYKSYSENVVIAFSQFKRNNWDAVSVNVFTAVSPPNLMYEDICNLAMDRLTSFIILPFHRRWYTDGSIESEDQTVRKLNFDILERAPCSVGILVEGRRNLKGPNFRDTVSSNGSPSYNIVVIFLGGPDDREALMLARRISQDKSVSLTVVHLKATNNNLGSILDDDERMLDEAVLRDAKGSLPLIYIEEHVNDGPETSDLLRSIVGDYQLFIVGRRYMREEPHTSGLQEWCEFKEIGVIGDLLASSDFIGNYTLLIVQQQLQRTA